MSSSGGKNIAIFRAVVAQARRLIAIAAMTGLPAAALADKSEQLNLKCVGEIAFGQSLPAAGARISFETTIPFGDGSFIALSNPETGKVEKLVYDMEALTGSFQIEQDPPQMIVWTRATGGWFVGQAIGGDGEIFSLTIRAAPAGSARRPFLLFGTAAGSVYRGSCI